MTTSRIEDSFEDMSEWKKKFPGDTMFCCQWCGIYKASKPRCSDCEPEEKKNRSVVIEEHTLGVIIGDEVQILRASILRGSPYANCGTIPIPTENFRPATREDFEDFNVQWHSDYTGEK